jgi:hypothetical protein
MKNILILSLLIFMSFNTHSQSIPKKKKNNGLNFRGDIITNKNLKKYAILLRSKTFIQVPNPIISQIHPTHD